MSTQIISGRDIADEIRAELKVRVASLKSESGITPGLATVLVGEDPASQMYVGMKNKAAEAMGIHSRQITLSREASEAELLGVVAGLNADPDDSTRTPAFTGFWFSFRCRTTSTRAG